MKRLDKYCLKLSDFQEKVKSTFGALRNDREFVDVTLACEDAFQIDCHKAILASSSPFFENILTKLKHPRPLIYMRGMSEADLVAMLDFIYFGEVNVEEEHLLGFLGLSEELGLKGLADSGESVLESGAKTNVKKSEDMSTDTHDEYGNVFTPKKKEPNSIEHKYGNMFTPKKKESNSNTINPLKNEYCPDEGGSSSKEEELQQLDDQTHLIFVTTITIAGCVKFPIGTR